MMTLTSCGGLIPVEMASLRMGGSVVAKAGRDCHTRASPAYPSHFPKKMDCRVKWRTRSVLSPGISRGTRSEASVRPGERDLVERLGPELLRGARHHAAAERAIELRRRIVVGEGPDHHALQPALDEIASGGGEEAAAKA